MELDCQGSNLSSNSFSLCLVCFLTYIIDMNNNIHKAVNICEAYKYWIIIPYTSQFSNVLYRPILDIINEI